MAGNKIPLHVGSPEREGIPWYRGFVAWSRRRAEHVRRDCPNTTMDASDSLFWLSIGLVTGIIARCYINWGVG